MEPLIARDPIGERTVYWTRDADGAVRHATRLIDLTPRRPSLDLEALRDYLTCAFVPGERTLFSGVRELRPGATLHADGSVTPGPELTESDWNPDAPIEAHAVRLRPLLEAAVRKRLPASGEPVGVYLSGGLDSSLVTALVCRLHNGPVHTFSLHFGADLPHELAFSQAVADHCGTRHTVLEFPASVIQRHLPESITALDDPIGDPLTTPNFLLGKAASEAGLKTILNGEGGDPVFGGPKNLPMLLHALYDDGTEDVRAAYFRSYQKCYDDLPTLLTPEVRKLLAAAPPQTELLAPFLDDDRAAMRSYLNRLMLINVRLKGADQILTKVANLTGYWGLRGESPLFDQAIVEAGFAIPPAYKLDGTREKAVLKESVKDLLPKAVLERPKSGMMVPVQRWFKSDLRPFAKDLLLSRRARIRPFLDQRLLRDWLDYRPMYPPRHGVKIWVAMTLEIWMRERGF